MTDLVWPEDILPVRAVFALRSNTATFRSPYNGSVQTLERPGAAWEASLTLPRLTHAKARVLFAFLAQLRGQAGRFRLWDHSHPRPTGAVSAPPLVNGGNQTGTSINVKGLAPGVEDVFLPGDYIGIGGELKMIVESADSDIDGTATLKFEPPLRVSPANESEVVIDKPTALMRLVDDRIAADWYNLGGVRGDFVVQCVEAI